MFGSLKEFFSRILLKREFWPIPHVVEPTRARTGLALPVPARLPGMKPKRLYLLLCVAGALLPYWQFVPWLLQHGPNRSLFFHELFANRISAFFGLDVIISAVVLLRFIRLEGARLAIRKWWIPVVAVLLVGVSLALPLFLYMREEALERFVTGGKSAAS